MSNINNLTNKIMDDAQLRAKSIIEEAKKEEIDIISKKVSEAEKIKAQMIEKSKEEGLRKKERIISSAHLKVRNDKLTAKQEMISDVFEKSIEKLNAMNDKEFLAFMKSSLLSANLSGDETIVVSENFKKAVDDKFLKSINEELNKLDKAGKLTLASEERNIKPGFIVIKNGIELNYTFEALVNSYREELGYEVANALFN